MRSMPWSATPGERSVVLVGCAAAPDVATVTGRDIDDAGNRLAVPRRVAVGDQRRAGDQVGRDLNRGTAVGRCIELVLDAESVEDERLLAGAPAAVALAHDTGLHRDRILQVGDRQPAQLIGGDPLFCRRGERIEHRILHADGLQVRQLYRDRRHPDVGARVVAGLHLDPFAPFRPIPG